MTYRVAMSDRANEDLDSVAGYVLPRAPLLGAAWMVRLEDAIAALAEFPEAHPLAPESPSVRGEVIRHLLYGTKPHIYRILFRAMTRSRPCSS